MHILIDSDEVIDSDEAQAQTLAPVPRLEADRKLSHDGDRAM